MRIVNNLVMVCLEMLSDISHWSTFKNTFPNISNSHAPVKKTIIRGANAPWISKKKKRYYQDIKIENNFAAKETFDKLVRSYKNSLLYRAQRK